MKNVYFIILIFICSLAFIATDCNGDVNGSGTGGQTPDMTPPGNGIPPDNNPDLRSEAKLNALVITYNDEDSSSPIVVNVPVPDTVVDGDISYNPLHVKTHITKTFVGAKFGIDSFTLSNPNATLSFASLPATNERSVYAVDSSYSEPTLKAINLDFNVPKSAAPLAQLATGFLKVVSEDLSNTTYYLVVIDKTLNSRSSAKILSSLTLDFSEDHVGSSTLSVTGGNANAVGTVTRQAIDTTEGAIRFDSGTIPAGVAIPTNVRIKAIIKSASSHIYAGIDKASATTQLNLGYGLTDGNAGEFGYRDSDVRNIFPLSLLGSGAIGYIIIVAQDGSQVGYTVTVTK